MQSKINYQTKVLDTAQEELESCDLCLVVGTSSVVYPAAMFAPQVRRKIILGSWNSKSMIVWTNIARITKAGLHKCPGKCNLNVNHTFPVRPFTVLSVLSVLAVLDVLFVRCLLKRAILKRRIVAMEVETCAQGCLIVIRSHISWICEEVTDRRRIKCVRLHVPASITLNSKPLVSQFEGICMEPLRQLKRWVLNWILCPQVASRGIPVAEFNMETTPATRRLGKHGFYFEVRLSRKCWLWL